MGKRILVADDSLTIQKAFAMVLGGQDYALVTARSADEALAAAKTARPDLVIADAVLGTGNGYDLCAAFRADSALRAVPVHILVSSQNPLDEARARRVGADGHLIKPFDSQTLLDSVSAALAAPVRSAPAPVAEAPAVAVPRMAPAAPAAAPPLAVERVVAVEAGAADDDDSYGEFTIERSEPGPTPWASRPPTWPGARPASSASPSPGTSPISRPSLIPGLSSPPPATASRPSVALPGVTAAAAGPSPLRPNRTMMGFPSAGASAPAPAAPASPPAAAKPSVPRPSGTQPAAASRPAQPIPAVPARPAAPAFQASPAAVAAPVSPAAPAAAVAPQPPLRRSASMPAVAAPTSPAPLVAAVSSAIDQKVAAIAARGREYEAIAKLSREIIEQVVWEVVPELAELIIRQEIDRLAAGKK